MRTQLAILAAAVLGCSNPPSTCTRADPLTAECGELVPSACLYPDGRLCAARRGAAQTRTCAEVGGGIECFDVATGMRGTDVCVTLDDIERLARVSGGCE